MKAWYNLILIGPTFAVAFCQPQPASAIQAEPAISVAQYPETSEGLSQLLTDAISKAKADDTTQVDQFIKEMEIPDYKHWFAETLNGSGSWSEAYGIETEVPNFGVSLKCGLHEMARRTGKIVVERKPDNQIGDNRKPLEVFEASWRDEGGSPTVEPQWRETFVYVDGGFRWYSIIRRAVVSIPPPLRPVWTPTPSYPYKPDGRHPGGIVRLSFVVRSNGTVDEVRPNGSLESTTDPKLIRAAVEAVRDYRFQPPSKDGSIEIRVKDVGFLVRPMEAYKATKP